MTSFWCFSIKGLRAWVAGADVFFCMKPFYSTSRALSVQSSRFNVQGSNFGDHHRPPSLLVVLDGLTSIKFGCGFAALCSLRLKSPSLHHAAGARTFRVVTMSRVQRRTYSR